MLKLLPVSLPSRLVHLKSILGCFSWCPAVDLCFRLPFDVVIVLPPLTSETNRIAPSRR